MNNNKIDKWNNTQETFYKICCDCLYYGYFWSFIKDNYKVLIDELGEKQVKKIYNKAVEVLESV